MPTYAISLSDGREFHVDAPDQDTAQRDLMSHIQPPPQKGGVLDAARQGAANLLGGGAETNKALFGGGDQTLNAAANAVAPKNEADTTLYDDKGLHAENIPNAVAESAPGVAASLAAARLTPGPIWAKLLAAGGVGAWQMLGPMAKQAATKRTGDANAEPNSDDLAAAAKRAVPEAALMSLPVGGLASRAAAKLGLGGVAGSVARSALDTAAGGAASAGSAAYDQASQGQPVDPNSVINAGLTGAAAMAPFAAGHTVGDVKAAVKFRGISDEDPAHIQEAANRISAKANDIGLNLRNQKQGDIAIQSAQTDVATERSSLLDTIKNANKPEPGSGQTQPDMPQDVQNALARAQKALPLSDSDTSALSSWAGSSGPVDDLVRLNGVSRSMEGVNGISNGLSSAMERHVRGIANPVGALAGVGVAHMGGFGYTPEAIAGLGGAWALARLNDAVTGNRSRAYAFTRRFADASGVPSLSPPQPQDPSVPSAPGSPQPQLPPGGSGLDTLNAMAASPWGPRPGVNPTGPSVPLAPAPAFNAKQFAPGVKDILTRQQYLAKLQQNSAEPVPAPDEQFNASSLKGPVQDVLKSRAYADKLRADAEAAQAPVQAPEPTPEPAFDASGLKKSVQASLKARAYADALRASSENQAPAPPATPTGEPPLDLSSFKGPVRAALNARMKVLAMQNKATVPVPQAAPAPPPGPEDIPAFLPKRLQPQAAASPPPAPVAAPAVPPTVAPAAQATEALKALVPTVTKLTKSNGQVTPTVEMKSSDDLGIPDFLRRGDKPIIVPKIEPARPEGTPRPQPLENLNTRSSVVGDVSKYFGDRKPGAPVGDFPDIPDFLKRSATNELPADKPAAPTRKTWAEIQADRKAQADKELSVPYEQAVREHDAAVAARALAKMLNERNKPAEPVVQKGRTAEELAMAPNDFAVHTVKQIGLQGERAQKAQATIARAEMWKRDVATKLASITGQKESVLFEKLANMKHREPAQKMRDFLVSKHPDDAAMINSLLSDEALKSVWKYGKAKQ